MIYALAIAVTLVLGAVARLIWTQGVAEGHRRAETDWRDGWEDAEMILWLAGTLQDRTSYIKAAELIRETLQ